MKANGYHIDDELLVKYLLGEANSAEKIAVDNWIKLNAENEKYFSHFQLIWEASKSITIPSTVNAEDAWKRFQQRTETASKKSAVVKPFHGNTTWLRAASIIAVTL